MQIYLKNHPSLIGCAFVVGEHDHEDDDDYDDEDAAKHDHFFVGVLHVLVGLDEVGFSFLEFLFCGFDGGGCYFQLHALLHDHR